MSQQEITHDPATWPRGNKVWDAARAFAMAEGANEEGSAPDRYNNPGDLSKGDEHGQTVSGYTTLPDGEEEIIFQAKIDGWMALYHKIRNILSGKSHVFSPTMPWTEIAFHYAGNSQAWVANVTRELDVKPTDPFFAFFGADSAMEDVIT